MKLSLAFLAWLCLPPTITARGISGRNLPSAQSATIASSNPGSSIRVDVDTEAGTGLEGSNEGNGMYVLLYRVAPGFNIQVMSNPQLGEIQIRLLGNPNQILEAGQKETLVAIAEALELADGIETSNVDELTTQGARAARLLSEWPDTLPLEFDYDPSMEPEEEDRPSVDVVNAPIVPDGGRRDLQLRDFDQEGDPSHHYRRLAYTSACSYVNSYMAVTHDDWNYDRWDDHTTFNAYLSMDPMQSCSEGTQFWTGSSWSCYEPDHDPNIEWAYGNCFGRCGGGCGSSTQFTFDCADHDSCVRFGHSLASFWCDDEFASTVDDALFAPNCF